MEMKKAQKLNFIEWNNNILINSIKKINLNVILTIVLDILFYSSSAFMTFFWLKGIEAKKQSIILPTPNDLIALGYERAQEVLRETKAFLFLLIFSAVIMLLAIIFLASILKGIIWAKTTNTKISFALISKFLVLNLIWISFWFLLVFLISWLVEPASALIFMITTIILGIYFTNTLYTIFMKEQKLKSIISAVKLNITKIHLFLLPYFVIALLFFILMRFSNFLKFRYSPILLGLIIIVYAAVVRYYASELVLKVKEIN
ncbi:hypothetical protein HYX00_03410 [Candidatus Woesearchaeota archaeon]|nr:hypothetical protein [Candidatus Woesearchaeota archaeon]